MSISSSTEKRKKLRAGGNARWGRGSGFCDSVEEHAEKARAIRKVPRGEREDPAGSEHPYELGHCRFGASKMEDHEVPEYGVEGGILERK